MSKKFGFTKWSWKRASGLTGLRQKIARDTGIPTTKAGIERKVGRYFISGFIDLINGK